MAVNVEFPTTLSNCKIKIPCATSDERLEVIKTMAQKTASLYAKLLTSKGHAERSGSLQFNHYPESFPSANEVDLFRATLAQNISERLLTSEKSTVRLKTRYIPEDCLGEILEKCDISPRNYPRDFHKYFPYHIYTQISLDIQSKVFEMKIEYLPPSI